MTRPIAPATVGTIVYCGTPDVAVPPLRALHEAGFDIALVVTGIDKPRGRGKALHPTPVKAAAAELGLPVSHIIDDCLSVGADLGVVVAYGHIIAPHVLDALPMVNLHFSLLPRWRGAAPVERALLAGDAETGVGVMEVADELDAGGIYRQTTVPIGPDATLDGLRGQLVQLGSHLLIDALRSGLGSPTPQVGEVVYAHKITADERRIDWSAPAQQVRRVVALGGAFTTFRGDRFKVWEVRPVEVCPVEVVPPEGTGLTDAAAVEAAVEAATAAAGAASGTIALLDGAVVVSTGSTALELVEVQPASKTRRPARTWSNGARLEPGERFSS